MKWLALVLVLASALGPAVAFAQPPHVVLDADGDNDGSDAGDIPDLPGPAVSASATAPTPAGESAGANVSVGGGAPVVATTTTGGSAPSVAGPVAHTPEPLTLAVTALGLIGAAALRRRRS